jgi:hypothetical protein
MGTRKRRRSGSTATQVVLAGVIFLMAGVPAWARYNPPPACNNPFTPEQELVEGRKIAAQVYQQMPVLPESDPVSRYVAQLGAHIVEHAPGAKWPFSFHVVASSDINAFALPGGAIFVNLGTIQAADTEAQLAGVLAHETSHVILRHSTCNIAKQQKVGILAGLAQLGSQILLGNGVGGQAVQTIIGGGAGLYGLRMSRDDEKQADLMGTDILYDAGYDPRGLPQFFETIQAKVGSGGAQMLSDHPNPGNRTEYVNAEIETLPRKTNPMVTSAAFTRAHTLAAKERTFTSEQIKDNAWKGQNYAAGPGDSAGGDVQTTGNTQPAVALDKTQLGIGSRMVSYRGPNFTLNYPSVWQASADSKGGVTIAPAGGAGAFGVAYGVIVDTAKAAGAIDDADSLANATMELAQRLSQQNGGMQQLGLTASLNINGQDANAMELRGRSPLVENGTTLPEHDWLITIRRPDGDLNYMVFVSPERDFARLRPVFTTMMNTFRAR